MSRSILSLLVILASAVAGANPTAPPATQPAEKPAQIIKVTNADELIGAIGPDRIIELAPGDYQLSTVDDRQMPFVRWDRKFDGNSITIRKVSNLAITGTGDRPVRLIAKPRYAFVLNFEDCHAVQLAHLTLGHEPDKGFCDSGVLGASNCSGLNITDCDLFGCGTEGLTLKDVQKVRVERSTIRDCSYGIMTITGCSDLAFIGCRFSGNREFYGVDLHDTRQLHFTSCTLQKNISGEALFQVVSCSDIRFEKGVIRNNEAKRLMDKPGAVVVTETEIAGNAMKEETPEAP